MSEHPTRFTGLFRQDIVDTVRAGLRKFEHETACGLIAVETLAVQREVLIKLCEEIESLRASKREWVDLTDEEVNQIWEKVSSKPFTHKDFAKVIETKLKEKNHG
jgi:hypothetical protein